MFDIPLTKILNWHGIW